MSKILLICFRDRENTSITQNEINMLSSRLVPDNISVNPPIIIERNGIFMGIFNPNSSLLLKDTSICAGHVIEPSSSWWLPSSPLPDGAYALIRSDDNTVELATDMVASRTIWHAQTEDMFVASTSQRAIISVLQSFEPNEAALVWMLSSGCLGPENSWDKRVKPLSPGTRLYLDRHTWKVTREEQEIAFYPTGHSKKQYEKELREALEYTFAHLSLDYSRWMLPLSGGLDSREILLKLKDRRNLKCITWGLSSAVNNKSNDAYIAKQLADHFHLPHQYFNLESSAEPLEKIFARFIYAGESRTDNVSAYLDGFQVWKSLFDAGVLGVIRGDEVFGLKTGWTMVASEAHIRQMVGALLLRDYDNLDTFTELCDQRFAVQPWPDRLRQKDTESLATWRDRLYQEFRVPVILASLNEAKCSYVEVVTPFLSNNIVRLIRTMPDSLRTDKTLFTKIVTAESPQIPYARHLATAALEGLLKTRETVDLMSDTISSRYFRDLFSDDIIDYILKKMDINTGSTTAQRVSLKDIARLVLPGPLRALLRNTITRPKLDHNYLAFRVYLAGKACQMFSMDANAFHQQRNQPS